MNEQLSQQEVAGAQSRVARILSEQTAQTQPAQPAQAVPSPNKTRKPTRRRTGTSNQASPSADSTPTVNISLPREIYDHFQKQADADERTLAKYLQRVVKQVYQQQQAGEQGIDDEQTVG